ncbi:MAG: Ldh family oxidoreductase [Azospirillaceae bacterium]|nr:Ldh family oxidoreductase [Azospirillaceae bacterium]
MSGTILIPAETIARQIRTVFDAWGMTPEYADVAVEVMVDTDLRGIDSHGIGMLPTYQRWFDAGLINPRPDIRVVREAGAVALVDADGSLGHPPSVTAMRLAIAKARTSGIGMVVVNNSNHYGAAGYYSLMAAAEKVIGLSLTNVAIPLVVPTFGRDAFLGTNPIAFAAPARKNQPFSLDMATSAVALGKLNVARRAGRPLPVGWAFDDRGDFTTDAQTALVSPRLAPLGGSRVLGGHKGYGLATMVEILCATLGGVPLQGDRIGHFFLAIDPAALRPDGGFGADLDGLMDRLRAAPPADPAQPVQVAGDPEYAAFAERTRVGIPITAILAGEVEAVCRAAGVPFLFGG